MVSFNICTFLLIFLCLWIGIHGDKCSYENCPEWKPDMLNVHLICHSHDDAGWLKTVDQYFWGSNQSISKDAVQYVLSTVTRELQHDPAKRFSYAETSFLWRWMMIQDDMTRHQIVKLVRNGQLEMVGGGWVQNDEAATHYAAIIDQMTIGHRFLNMTFGRCGIPRVAWQIDTFGHSRESASLFAQMGLEGLFFARLHYIDRAKRRAGQTMEMLWRGSDDLGNSSDIFTHAFYDHYTPPPGFCFDDHCDDDPIMDDPRLEGFNVDERIDQFIAYVKQQAQAYQTNHILLTMGSDFHYMNAGRWFSNLDKLIKYVNKRQNSGSKIHVLYSTPTCYMKAVKEADIKLTTKTDDFFPLADNEHSYWTGFYTSRPSLKGAVRQASNVLQACQAMDAIGDLGSSDFGDVDVLHRSMGILQHHDAITGTAKQHVTNDYTKMLHEGLLECQQVFNDAISKLAPRTSKELPPYQTFCFNLNSSACNVSQEHNKFIITLFNGMAHPINTFFRLPVGANSYIVHDPSGHPIPAQIAKTFATSQFSTPQGPYDLIFPITVPALGYSTYFVARQIDGKNDEDSTSKFGDDTIKNELLSVIFDSTTGLMKSVSDMNTDHVFPLNQNFYWYMGAIVEGEGHQASGAYDFRPNGTKPYQVASGAVKIEKIMGPHVQEMRQTFSPWMTQTVRLYKGKPYIELEWTVGPIPYNDSISKEIITRFETSIDNQGVFWIDSNGRQMMKRMRNFQPTYPYNDSEPIAANYYPVNTRIAIKDSRMQLTVLTDRSQGGSSINNGSIELMIHRRLFEQDGSSMDEPLNETGTDGRGLVIRGKHWILLSDPSISARLHRQYSMEMFYQPIPILSPLNGTFEEYMQKFKIMGSGIQGPVPPNGNILTFAQWRGTEILIRLEHLYQKMEDSELSKPVTINLKEILASFEILSIEELTLAANAPLANSKNDWHSGQSVVNSTNELITLQAMQIRTFRCMVRNKITTQRNTIRRRFGKMRQ